MSQEAEGMANSVDPDHPDPKGAFLILISTVCSDLSVPILRFFKFTVKTPLY